MDENCRDIYNEKYDEYVLKDNVVSERDENKNVEGYISSVFDVQDGSLSCFDVKFYVFDKEIKDLFGNEDSLSEGISIVKYDVEKKLKECERRGSFFRNIFKYFFIVDKKIEKKSSIREKRFSVDKRFNVDKKRDNELVFFKAVFKFLFGFKNVFLESVFENIKLVFLKENVFILFKGIKIVLKLEFLKVEKKFVLKNSLFKKEYDVDREFFSQLKRKYVKEDLKIVLKYGSQKKESVIVEEVLKDRDLLVFECLNFELNFEKQRMIIEE